MSTAIVPVETRALARDDGEWSVEHMVAQAKKIQECMNAVMVDGEHYGVIPGTQGRDGKPPKKTLLKPGAEKLCLMFRLCPEYETLRAEQSSALISYTVRCILTHIPSGNRIATGLGSCNSREKKYSRPADRKCPSCSKETIIKGKEEYGGGWLCFAKKGGCNAKFKDGDPAIEKQDNGVADPSDLDNTILKMACKRALVAAVLNGTAASDCFTQDLEDLTEKAAEYTPPAKQEAPQDGPKASPSANGASSATATAPAPVPASRTRRDVPVNYVPGNKVPVKAGDKLAVPAQVARVHVLAGEIGLDDDTYRATWLKAYKAHDGKQVTSSKDLTFDQIANLIKRMEAQKARNDITREAMEQESAANLAAVVPPPPTLAALFVQHMDRADEAAAWLQQLFNKDRASELDKDEAETAFYLLSNYGTPTYQKALTDCKAMGRVL